MIKISAIIMASGLSSRMGQSKLFLTYRGKTFVEHTLDLVSQLPFHEKYLIIQAADDADIRHDAQINRILNSFAETGQSASVRLGTEVSKSQAYMYLPIDQPLLSTELCLPLMEAATTSSIVFPMNKKGKHYSPIIFGDGFREELTRVTGKFGGREVKQAHKDAWNPIVFEDVTGFYDVDTSEEYQTLMRAGNE